MTLAAAVADEVRRRLASRGTSQTQLARAAGIAPTLLHRALKGQRDLTLDDVERLAPALGVTPLGLLRSAVTNAARDRAYATQGPGVEGH